ncbi:MAG: sugar transferase [Hyphomicrobiaceae bacterium]|nr:sugar transferase [Hyphomicrobiaceae bacterium]
MRRFWLLLLDLSLVASATVLAAALRHDFHLPAERIAALIPYLLLTLGAAAVVLPAFGTGRSVWRLTTLRDYLRLTAATALVVAGGVALGFAFNRLDGIARSVPVLQALVMLFALVGVRVLLRLRHAARQRPLPLNLPEAAGSPARTVLVVGLSRLTEAYLLSIHEFSRHRVRVAGLLGSREGDIGRIVLEHPVLGTPENVGSVLQELELHGVSVDSIVVATRFSRLSPQARQALLDIEQSAHIPIEFLAEHMGLDEHLRQPGEAAATEPPPARTAFAIGAAELGALAARPYWRVKRAIDFLAALAGLIALAPVMGLVALLVAFDVGRPVAFPQQRPGLGGRPFRLCKFRTMGASHDAGGRRIPDAERLSAIGRLLRRTRLDELPQLWYVLTGDMSFIGPRPLLPVDQSPAYAMRLLVRPGVTGWAQVMGGRDISALDKAALDVWYVHNASLRLDFEILMRTVPLMLFGERISRPAIERAWRDLVLEGICRIDPAQATAAAASWPPAGNRSQAA